jgi:hypothetical protein
MITETRPPKGYAWGAATIQTWALVGDARVVTSASVPALMHACGYLCLHKPVVEGFGLWTVTHVPSGMMIAILPTQALARGCITSLLALPRLRDETPPPSLRSAVAAIVSSLPSPPPRTTTTRSSRPSGTPRSASLSSSSFSPVFRGYAPTPADRAAQNIAALSLGTAWNGGGTTDLARFLSEAERAAATHAREEIVVRVTQPPRALLLPADIPSQLTTASLAPSGTLGTPATRPIGTSSSCSLRDGTPATPGEFRRRYQQLLDLGDRLRAGSRKFQILYREGEREGWTTDRLDRWEAIDGKFVSLVQEAWLVWSGAAFCFDCAPEEFQRNVVAKLGFIGSREKGWHELGIKTFLRHPEVAEVQPLRREMREKIGARL